MFACICSAVSEHEVDRALDAGADSVEAIGELTGAGTTCGGCHDRLEDMVSARCPFAALVSA